MDNKSKSIVVVSRRNSIAIGAIRAIGAAGYKINLIESTYREGTSNLIAQSKYVNDVVEVVGKKIRTGEDIELVEAIINKGKELNEKAVLLPTDEYTTYVVEHNREQLEKYYDIAYSLNGNYDIKELMEKTFQRELAREAGLLTPQEWLIDFSDMYPPKDITYPCLCGANSNVIGYKRDKKICEDASELRRYINLAYRRSSEREIIAESLVEADTEIYISGIAMDEKIFIPGYIKRIRIVEDEEQENIKLVREICSWDELDNTKEKIENLMSMFKYNGLFTVKLLKVADDVIFNEVIFSATKEHYIYLKKGVNFIDILLKNISNEDINAQLRETISGKNTFVFEDVLWKRCQNGYITRKEVNELIERADITYYKDQSDEKLGDAFNENVKYILNKKKVTNAKRGIKRIIKKYILPPLRKVKYWLFGYPQTKKMNRRNPNSNRPRVIVTGRNYGSNLCIARALGQAGYEVEILRIFHRKPKFRSVFKKMKPEAYSSYVKAFWTCVYGGKSRRVINKLKQIADLDNKMLIVPADDLMACIIDDYLDELSEFYVLPNVDNKEGQINYLMSKDAQKELAFKAGLPALKSCVIKTVNGEFEIPDTVTYPCFIKPNISKNGSKTKMRKCDSKIELTEAMEELAAEKDVEMLVEDYVEIKREYSILGVSTKNGAIGPGYFGAEEGGQNEHRGIAITGKVLPVSCQQKLVDDIVKFVGSLKFDGLYDVDLIETEDGKMYFVELNMRFGGSGYAITKSGVNLPGMFADYMLLGKEIDYNCNLENAGKRFVSEKILIEEYVKNRISKKRVNEIMDEVDIHFIKDEYDKKPFNYFKRFYVIAWILRILGKIKDNSNTDFEK